MDVISNWLTQFILFIGEQTQIFWNNLILLDFSWSQIGVDILIVSIIFYYMLVLLKGTRAVHVIVGLLIIVVVFFISQALELVALRWLIDRVLTVALIAIPIIFQRELRMGLERIGRTKLYLNQKARQIDAMISNIVGACATMAQEKTGALIVLQNAISLKEYIETGVELEAKVTSELLESIFNKKSPLHDGAVIIAKETIQAASCILPHSYENTSSGLGTRHKAGIGLSEITDAAVIIVSEEKGNISFASEGKLLKNITPTELHQRLKQMLNPVRQRRPRRSKNAHEDHSVTSKNRV